MESPVVVDKPPEYHGNNDRGFPFDEEEGSGAWSELAARHPDIAARLRQRPATWARKRRPSSQDATDDFGESFSGFDSFPFDDIPPEFREHFPSRWNRRFSEREQPPAEQPPPAAAPHHHTAATQTERAPDPEHSLPQYGLRNTVDLGQSSPADPSVDADDRTPRSMSAPPDAPRTLNPDMSAHNHQGAAHAPPHHEHHSNVRHIPIFVEGRDEPVINKTVDHGTHFGETKPAFQPPPPPPPHIDRDQYFADDGPVGFHHPPNFTRAFGTPFNKGFRQGPQPFVQQKAYPQNAFARGASPQRSQSPKPQPPQEEHFVKVPVQHEHAPPKTEPPSRAQQKPPPPQPSPQQQAPQPPREQTPPKPQQATSDPITQILSIQTDVLNLMTEVENFKGTKKDKRYLFLDEMLTRNLIKLDNIETEGKENIRQARREAIRCIEKCIAVLEAKADSNTAKNTEPQDVEMKENSESTAEPELVTENGEVEMKEVPKQENTVAQPERTDEAHPPKEEIKEDTKPEEASKPEETPKPQDTPKSQETPNPQETPKPQETPNPQDTEIAKPQEEQIQEPKTEAASENTASQFPATDTRPEETKPDEKIDEQKKVENKPNPKKKVVKKRDKSKEAPKENHTEEASKDIKSSNKTEAAERVEKVEVMQVDDKGDKPMEVDGAASQ